MMHVRMFLALAFLCACSGGEMSLPDSDAATKDATKDALVLDAPPIVDAPGDAPGYDAFVWPDCMSMPKTAKVQTIPQIWTDNPMKPVETWISGVYVTAVSHGACTGGQACTFFVQQDTMYASLQAAAHKGIKVFASAQTSQYFTGIQVGDKVDLLGWAWRYNISGENELLLQVNLQLPGCFKKVGTGTAVPVTAVLGDFSVNAYENTLGPVLVQVDGVSGTPQNPDETFGLYKTGMPSDAGIQSVTSLSPYYLPNGVFVGLTKGMKYNFTHVIGVFGLFVPPSDGGTPTKYLEIYPRTMMDIQ